MTDIDTYKRNFVEKGITSDVVDLVNDKISANDTKRIGKVISDMDIYIPDAINGIFDKLTRPILVVCDDNIEYANDAFLKMLGFSDYTKVINEKFLKFVSRDDWNFIAENIGDILTKGGTIELRMLNSNYRVIKVSFDTVYIEDSQHFCFILLGKPVEVKASTNTLLYDECIGLPKFGLYEYSVQKAIDYETYKMPSIKRSKVVVCGIAIKNYVTLKNDGQIDFVIQRMAEKLLLSMNKLYTIAVGTKFPFWLLMPDMQSDIEIEQELLAIQSLLNQPINNNQLRYDISVAMGVSVYPNEAQSAKKIISQAEMAIAQAMKNKQSSIVYYGH